MRADWAGYYDRVADLLRNGHPEITHTIARIKQEAHAPQPLAELRNAREWRYAAEGRDYYQSATNRGLALTPLVDENNEVVAITFRLAGGTP